MNTSITFLGIPETGNGCFLAEVQNVTECYMVQCLKVLVFTAVAIKVLVCKVLLESKFRNRLMDLIKIYEMLTVRKLVLFTNTAILKLSMTLIILTS